MKFFGPARPLRLAVIVFVFGLVVGSLFYNRIDAVAVLTVAVGAAAFYFGFKGRSKLWILPVLAALLFGVWRGATFYLQSFDWPDLPYGKTITAEGEVVAQAEPARSQLRFALALSRIDGNNATSKILVYAPLYSDLRRGDYLALQCRLIRPEAFDNFDYDKYLAGRNIYGQCFDSRIIDIKRPGFDVLGELDSWRRSMYAKLKKQLPPFESALAGSVVLGIRAGLPAEARDDLQRSGLLHISAVSGMHIGILLVLIVAGGLALGFNRRHLAWPAIALIIFYVIIVGAPPSALRAGIMAVLFLLALNLGRIKSAGHVLILAGGLMAGFRPSLLFEAGFQLSFGAMLGIIYIYPLLKKLINKPDKAWLDLLLVTIAVQIAIWPVAVYHFQSFSAMTFVANLLVLPVLPFAFGATLLFLLFSYIAPALAAPAAYAVYYLWHYILSASRLLSALAGAGYNFSMAKSAVMAYYAILLGAVWFFHQRARLNKMTKID